MNEFKPYQDPLHSIEESHPRQEPVWPDRNDAAVVRQQRVLVLLRLAAQRPDERAITLRLQPGVVNALARTQEGPALVVLFRVLDHEVLGVVDQLHRRVAASVRRQGHQRLGVGRPALDENAADFVAQHQEGGVGRPHGERSGR